MKNIDSDRPTIVFSDFDGTITTQDTLVYLLNNFGHPSWIEIEEMMERGELIEADGLKAEFSLLKVDWDSAVEAILAEIEIDPEFPPFVQFLQSLNIPLIILSGGVGKIIRLIFEREGLTGLEIRANDALISDGKWRIIPSNRPRIKGLCNHCKSHSVIEMKEKGWNTIYIGDGLTDRCPSQNADLVIAKGKLADFYQSEGIEHHRVESFAEIRLNLKSVLKPKPMTQRH